MGTEELKIGSVMPGFSHLPGVDGKKYSSNDFLSKKILCRERCSACGNKFE
jgi:hypothetical protein